MKVSTEAMSRSTSHAFTRLVIASSRARSHAAALDRRGSTVHPRRRAEAVDEDDRGKAAAAGRVVRVERSGARLEEATRACSALCARAARRGGKEGCHGPVMSRDEEPHPNLIVW